MPNEMHALGISYERRLFGVTIVHTYRGSGSMALTTIRDAEEPTEYSKKSEMFDITSRRRNARSPYWASGVDLYQTAPERFAMLYSRVCRKKFEFRDKELRILTKARHGIFD